MRLVRDKAPLILIYHIAIVIGQDLSLMSDGGVESADWRGESNKEKVRCKI